MTKDFIAFNAIPSGNHLLLVSATTVGKNLPDITTKIDLYTANEKAIFLSTADIVDDFDASLRIIIGNIPPSHMHELLTLTLDVAEGEMYIGDTHKEAYTLLSLPKGSTQVSIHTDASDHVKHFYVYIEAGNIDIKESRTPYEPDEKVVARVTDLGKKNGCHICGTRTEAEYIPHLLPPLEIEADGEKNWYPICKRDYSNYQQEIHGLLLSVI